MGKFVELTTSEGVKALINTDQVLWIQPTDAPSSEQERTTLYFNLRGVDQYGKPTKNLKSLQVSEEFETIKQMVLSS